MDLTAAPAPSTRDLGIVALALAAALMILALPAQSAGTLALVLLGAVVAWFVPAAMVAVVIVTVPIQDLVVLPFVAGSLTLTQIALFGLALGWGLGFWRRTIWLDGIFWWFVAILGALSFSLIAAAEVGPWAEELYRWAAAALFYLVARSVLRDGTAIRVALWGIVVAVCGASSFGIGQVIASNGPDHMIDGGVLRAFGAFGTPNPFAAYIEFTVPMLLAIVLVGLHARHRATIGRALWAGAAVASTLGGVILTLTQSRGGWVGFAAAMLVLLWILPWRWRAGAVAAGVVLVGLILLTPPGQSQLTRFADSLSSDASPLPMLVDVASTGREAQWGAASAMFVDHPLTGVGAGQYDYHFRDYTPDWYKRLPLGQAHNGYLHMAAQAGIPGVATFLGWIIAMLVSLRGALRCASSPFARGLALGALACVVAFCVHSVVDYLNVLSLGLQLSAVVAIGLNAAPGRSTVDEPRLQQMTTLTPLQAGHA